MNTCNPLNHKTTLQSIRISLSRVAAATHTSRYVSDERNQKPASRENPSSSCIDDCWRGTGGPGEPSSLNGNTGDPEEGGGLRHKQREGIRLWPCFGQGERARGGCRGVGSDCKGRCGGGGQVRPRWDYGAWNGLRYRLRAKGVELCFLRASWAFLGGVRPSCVALVSERLELQGDLASPPSAFMHHDLDNADN